jgi:hypothetical protein
LAVLLDRLPLNPFAAQAQELTPRTTSQAEIRKLQTAVSFKRPLCANILLDRSPSVNPLQSGR